MECIGWPKGLFLTVFEPFQVPSKAGLTLFPGKKKGVRNGRYGVSCVQKQVGLFRRIFTSCFEKESHNSFCSSRSDRPHFFALIVRTGHGRTKISGAQKKWFWRKKKVGFLILWNHCSVVSDLNSEFYTEGQKVGQFWVKKLCWDL